LAPVKRTVQKTKNSNVWSSRLDFSLFDRKSRPERGLERKLQLVVLDDRLICLTSPGA